MFCHGEVEVASSSRATGGDVFAREGGDHFADF